MEKQKFDAIEQKNKEIVPLSKKELRQARKEERRLDRERDKEYRKKVARLRDMNVDIVEYDDYNASRMEKVSYKVRQTKLYQYFDFKNLDQEVGGIENNFSFRKYILTLAFVPILALAASMIYKLSFICSLFVALSFLLFVPSLVLSTVKQNYQKRKFSEANSYIEQMIYSFKRNGKIITALQDTQVVANGSMRRVIDKALTRIISGNFKEDLYREALKEIEDEYKCTRIKILHTFLMNVEQTGGSFNNQINILLDDARDWATRNMSFQQDVKDLKKRTLLSELMAIVLCAVMLYVVPAEQMDSIIPTVLYQLLTTGVMIMFMLLYVIIQKRLTCSWLDLENIKENKDKDFDKDYNLCIEHVGEIGTELLKAEKKKAFKKAIIFLVFVPVLILIGQPVYSLIPILIAFMVGNLPQKKLKGAKERVATELQIQFPIWIRQLTLHLQTENVFNALIKSQEDCPHAIEAELNKLILAIREEPNSNKPYLDFFGFLGDNNSNEMKRLVRSLYAMSETGTEDKNENDSSQLNALIAQNAKLTDNAERLANKNKLDGLSILVMAPMAIGTAKMFVDLGLYCGTYMAYFEELNSTGLGGL